MAADPSVSPADTIRRALALECYGCDFDTDGILVRPSDLCVLHGSGHHDSELITTFEELLAVGERDGRRIARLTEALDEARETLWVFDKEPVLAPGFDIVKWKQRLFRLRVKLDSLASACAVLAGEEDAGNG